MDQTATVNTKVSWKKVLLLTGALVSYLVGSGFASGQEVMQFYSGYGSKAILAIIVTEGVFIWMALQLYTLGYKKKFENPYEVYGYYLGKYAGKVYEWYSVLLFYLFFVIMAAGGGAVLNQYYGVNVTVGTVVIGVVSMLSCLLGLQTLIEIIGRIGPAVIIFTIIIGAAAIIYDPTAVTKVDGIIASLPADAQPAHAAANWLLSAVLYNALCLAIGLPFFIECGAKASSVKEAKVLGVVGFTVYTLAILLVTLSQFAFMDQITTTQIPQLFIAQELIPPLAMLFSIVVLVEIYTTTAPMLWATARAFAPDKTKKSYIIIFVAGIIGIFGGNILPFGQLVNLFYPAMSWLALAFMIVMVAKQFIFKDKSLNEKAE